METRQATPGEVQESRRCSLVWIDAREAVIVHLEDGWARLERFESDVPAHHRATGHVRHEPSVRHGGGGPQQTAGEPHRLEHLTRFVERIADRLPADEDLLILGPGTVRDRLLRRLRTSDEHHRSARRISSEASPRLTGRQLVARLRQETGSEPRRRTVGAYRWTEPPDHLASGKVRPQPHRVVDKPRHERAVPED